MLNEFNFNFVYFFENILVVFNKNLSYRMLIYNCIGICLVKPKKQQHVIVSMFTSNHLNCQMRAQADRATGLKPVSKVRISAEFQGPIFMTSLYLSKMIDLPLEVQSNIESMVY